jgi:hypothetical protein
VLADQMPGPGAAPRARLAATMLVAMVRSVTSAEVLAEVRDHRTAAARQDALRAWITTAATMVSCLDRQLPEQTAAPSGKG